MSEFGIRAVIAPSFADIFRINAGNNGLLLIDAEEATVQRIAEQAQTKRPYELTIDLENQTIAADCSFSVSFEIEPFRRHRLLRGLDEIAMTLTHEAEIARFERQHQAFLQDVGPSGPPELVPTAIR